MKKFLVFTASAALTFSGLFAVGGFDGIITADQGKEKRTAVLSVSTNYTDIQTIKEESDLVVEAKVSGVNRIEKDYPENLGSTFYDVKVKETLKGVKETKSVIVRQEGYKDDSTVISVHQNPSLESGQKYILFLKESNQGFYYISGSYQGKFQIKNDKVYSQPSLNDEVMDAKALNRTKPLLNSEDLLFDGDALSSVKEAIKSANN